MVFVQAAQARIIDAVYGRLSGRDRGLKEQVLIYLLVCGQRFSKRGAGAGDGAARFAKVAGPRSGFAISRVFLSSLSDILELEFPLAWPMAPTLYL